uniref:Ovule protein n=1 Tax=Steinernema glaseri TaxID=37863 RepID=A0A1I7Y7Y5_9BILA
MFPVNIEIPVLQSCPSSTLTTRYRSWSGQQSYMMDATFHKEKKKRQIRSSCNSPLVNSASGCHLYQVLRLQHVTLVCDNIHRLSELPSGIMNI